LTLRSEISTPEGKRRYVRRLFATIADRYDFITRVLSYGQDQRWKRRLIELANIGPDDRVLDLACGTGDIVGMAARRARSGIGLDVTLRMLQLAAERRRPEFRTANAEPPEGGTSPASGRRASARSRRSLGDGANQERGTRVCFVCGDMLALPFAGGHFDVVTIGYGLRNVPDLRAAVQEIHRVLVPSGRVLSLDFNRPENRLVRTVYLVYLTVVGSMLGGALHGDPDTYRYIPESMRNYPGARGVTRLFEQHGFADVRVVPVLGGLMSIHVAKKESGITKQDSGLG